MWIIILNFVKKFKTGDLYLEIQMSNDKKKI